MISGKLIKKIKLNSIILAGAVIIAISAKNGVSIEPPTYPIDGDFILLYDSWAKLKVMKSGTPEDIITIDLNGKRLYGNGSGSGIDMNGHSYIEISGNYQSWIDGYDTGIVILGTDNIIISQCLTIENCDYGIYIRDSEFCNATGGEWSTIEDCYTGIYARNCMQCTFDKYWIFNNSTGLYSRDNSSWCEFRDLTMEDNTTGTFLYDDDRSIYDRVDVSTSSQHGVYTIRSEPQFANCDFDWNGRHGMCLTTGSRSGNYNSIDVYRNGWDGLHISYSSYNNTFNGCRGYYNTDDDLDDETGGNQTYIGCVWGKTEWW